MNKNIARLAAASVMAVSTLAVAPSANAGNVEQFCVDFSDNGNFSAHLAEDRPTWEAMLGHHITTFVNTPQGCSGLSEGDGYLFTGPLPDFGDEVCDPKVIIKEVEVPGPERIVEVSSVQTVDNPKLLRKIKRQAATIKRLRAKLSAVR